MSEKTIVKFASSIDLSGYKKGDDGIVYVDGAGTRLFVSLAGSGINGSLPAGVLAEARSISQNGVSIKAFPEGIFDDGFKGYRKVSTFEEVAELCGVKPYIAGFIAVLDFSVSKVTEVETGEGFVRFEPDFASEPIRKGSTVITTGYHDNIFRIIKAKVEAPADTPTFSKPLEYVSAVLSSGKTKVIPRPVKIFFLSGFGIEKYYKERERYSEIVPIDGDSEGTLKRFFVISGADGGAAPILPDQNAQVTYEGKGNLIVRPTAEKISSGDYIADSWEEVIAKMGLGADVEAYRPNLKSTNGIKVRHS